MSKHAWWWSQWRIAATWVAAGIAGLAALPAGAQEVLPFPPKPSGSLAGRTMQESIYSPLPAVNHLSKDAPNILIVTTSGPLRRTLTAARFIRQP